MMSKAETHLNTDSCFHYFYDKQKNTLSMMIFFRMSLSITDLKGKFI